MLNYHEVANIACNLGASQDPVELAAALEVVAVIEPKVIVEIGCDRGGTLYAWRRICERVYGITLADNSNAVGGSELPLVDYGAVVHIGDSHDPSSRDWLAEQLAGAPIDVLVIDGDHSKAGVLADLDTYGRLVRDGGLILLHDIATNDPRAVGVSQVWRDIRNRFASREIGNRYGWGVIYR